MVTEQIIRERFYHIINGKGPVIPRIAVEIAVDDLCKAQLPTPDPPTEPGVYWAGREDMDGATDIKYRVWQIGEIYANSEGRLFIWFLREHYPIALDELRKDIIWQGPIKEPE